MVCAFAAVLFFFLASVSGAPALLTASVYSQACPVYALCAIIALHHVVRRLYGGVLQRSPTSKPIGTRSTLILSCIGPSAARFRYAENTRSGVVLDSQTLGATPGLRELHGKRRHNEEKREIINQVGRWQADGSDYMSRPPTSEKKKSRKMLGKIEELRRLL